MKWGIGKTEISREHIKIAVYIKGKDKLKPHESFAVNYYKIHKCIHKNNLQAHENCLGV